MALILVVDDHADTLNFVRRLIEKWGYKSIGADSGEAALAMLAKQVPDLIIVDGMMPGMNGAEFIRLVRINVATAATPAILYTAIADRAFSDNAIEKGANEVWHKGQIHIDHMRNESITTFLLMNNAN